MRPNTRAVLLTAAITGLLTPVLVAAPQAHAATFTGPTVTSSFNPDRVSYPGKTTLTITISNPNPIGHSEDVTIDDSVEPTVFKIANPSNLNFACSGTATATSGSSDITISTTVAGSSFCLFSVDVVPQTVGALSDNLMVTATDTGATTTDGTLTVVGPRGPRLFFTDQNDAAHAVKFVATNGSGAGGLFSYSGQQTSTGLVLDPAAAAMYWLAYDGTNHDRLWHASLNGAPATTLNTGSQMFMGYGLAFDKATHRIFWTPSDAPAGFSYSSTSGSAGPHHVGITGAGSSTGGLAIDRKSRRIYWASVDGVQSSKLDGSGLQTIDEKVSDLSIPNGLAVDVAAARVYWANYGNNTIEWSKIDGSASGVLNTTGATVNEPWAVAVDPVAHRLYWSNEGITSLSYASLAGGHGGDLNIDRLDVHEPASVAVEYPPMVGKPFTVKGKPTVGSVLRCDGSWAGDLAEAQFYRAPHTVTYQWRRNGHAIKGAAKSHYTPTRPGKYQCRTTASNDAGSTSKTSPTRQVRYPSPGTKLTRSTVAGHHATFHFKGSGRFTRFQCALTRRGARPSYRICTSPKTYRNLTPGRYKFAVRAVGPGGADPTPVKFSFRIKRH